jgi:hypothetical protein
MDRATRSEAVFWLSLRHSTDDFEVEPNRAREVCECAKSGSWMSRKRRVGAVIRWTYKISLDVMQTVAAMNTFAVKNSVEDGHDGISRV